MKKLLVSTMLFMTVASASLAGEILVLRVGLGISTHLQPFMVAMAKGKDFKDSGVWLEPAVEKEKYDLMVNGVKTARLNVLFTKGAADSVSLFAQGHLDLALNSFPAMLAGIDRGVKIKVLSPPQADGIAMLSNNDISDVKGWDGFSAYVGAAKRPVLIGYHSPTSAPKIVVEGAMQASGFRITGDARATKADADILMVDLKSISNLIPALVAKQVEFCVAPAPTPEVVESKGQGHIVLQLSELPPAGRWANFPCCCITGTEKIVAEFPEAVGDYMKLLYIVAKWCMENKHEAATVTSEWMGVPVEVIEKAHIRFFTDVTPDWLANAEMYAEILNRLGQLTGKLKGKKLANTMDQVFDFRFVTVSE